MPKEQIWASSLANILKGAEPLSSGFNTDVYFFDQEVLKVIGDLKRPKEKKINLTSAQATWLGNSIALYEGQLKAAGMLMPSGFNWLIDQLDEDPSHYFLIVRQQFVGRQNAKVELKAANSETQIQQITGDILMAMEPIFLKENLGQLGIDPLPENFLYYQGGIYYVDLFPPRCKVEDRFITEYPEPISQIGQQLGYWKHYTIEGLMVVFLTQLARIRPDYFKLYWEEVNKRLIDHGQRKASDNINQWILSTSNHSVSAVGKVSNPYQLRLIACQLAARNELDPILLEKIFGITHYEDGDFILALKSAKRLILDGSA